MRPAPPFRPGGREGSGRNCDDRGACRRPVIDTKVRAGLVQDRVVATARNPRRDHGVELQRRLQKETPHRCAGLVEVGWCLAVRRETHRAHATAFIDELRCQNRTIPGTRASLAIVLLDENLEAIAGLQLGI
jgi:hypothetical protein